MIEKEDAEILLSLAIPVCKVSSINRPSPLSPKEEKGKARLPRQGEF